MAFGHVERGEIIPLLLNLRAFGNREAKIGEGSDFLEILGGGMVHPNVLTNCGLDPDEWQGFAFGMGVDRLAILKYGMPDLRDTFTADVRWLAHYGFSAFQDPNLVTGLS